MEAKSNPWEVTNRKNVRHLAYWTAAWALTMALTAFGPKFLWDYNSSISILFILVDTLIGIGMIVMNRKYLNGLDEMQRKVNLDAMAIALGVGVVAGMSYSMLDAAKIISLDAEIGYLVGLIGITYFIAFIVGSIRYK